MVAMAATHRRGLSAHEPHRRRRLLAGARAERARARDHGARGRRARSPRPSFIASTRRIPSRGPLAALTVPGAIGGWMLALEAARAVGGKGLPLDVLLDAAIGQARDGYVVAKSQARLTDGKARRVEGRARLRRDVPARRQAAGGGHEAQAERARLHARSPGARRARRFLSRRCRPRDRRRSRKNRQPGDARRSDALSRPGSPSRSASTLNAGTVYNTPPPTQGLASLIILALYERLRVARSRELRVRPRPGRGDQARVPRARPLSSPIRLQLPQPPERYPRSQVPRRRGGQDRSPEGGEMAGAARRGRHDLDGRGRLVGPRGVLHPVALLGVRLGLRAAEDRRADAEPRLELLARSQGAEPARARPPAVPHAQPGARRARRRPRHGLRHDGRRRPAADRRP